MTDNDFYGRWLDKPYWTQEEFEYLFFGYDPESPDTEEVFKTEVLFSDDKLESHDYFTKMIIKAIKTGRLNNLINNPFTFFGWSYENPHLRKIIPPKMLEAVEIKIKQTEDKKLSTEPATTQPPASKPLDDKPDKTNISESERESVLKLILGMAINAYGYQPFTERSPATGTNKGSIHYALSSMPELSIKDAKTIRKYIKEAEALFLKPPAKP